jgi:hypothetical protein
MENTLGFFSTDGRNWTPKGVVFSESQLALWVPSGAQHLWAPAAMQDSNGTTHLFVPDVTNTSLPDSQHPWTTPNVHTSARTFVSGSMPGAGPFGPYWITLPITDEFGNDPGYMSDPEPFQDSTGRYLLWANGDGDTCGGLSVGRFGATISSVTQIQELTITGFPSTLATCSYKSPFANKEGRGASVNHPYMEGPSLFKLSDMSSRPGLPGPYTLVFAAKPTSRPSECISGTSSEYEVIAYATSSSVTGPYAYQGILMCGSTTEWTNQATLTTISTAAGAERLVMIYHDGPAGGIHNRRLHAECMFFGRGTIAGVVRSATGFADCMNGANADAWVLRSRRPKYAPPWGIVTANVDQGARLYASRSQVGPWERFDVLDQNGVPISPTAIGQWSQVRIRAQANNKWVCAENAGRGQLVANRSQVGAWEKFSLWAPDGVFAQLDSEESSLGVNTDTYQRLYPDSPPRAPQEYFDILHL